MTKYIIIILLFTLWLINIDDQFYTQQITYVEITHITGNNRCDTEWQGHTYVWYIDHIPQKGEYIPIKIRTTRLLQQVRITQLHAPIIEQISENHLTINTRYEKTNQETTPGNTELPNGDEQ